jgi:hypothetical protein
MKWLSLIKVISRNFMSLEDNNEISSFPKYKIPLLPLPHKMVLRRYVSETDFPELAD